MSTLKPEWDQQRIWSTVGWSIVSAAKSKSKTLVCHAASKRPVSISGKQTKVPSGKKPAVGGNRVDVRMEMDQLAEGLHSRDQPGDQIVPAEHVANHFDHAFPSGAGQFAEQAAVVAEVQAEPFGDGEDQLTVGNGLADGVGNRVGGQQGAFLMATGAQAALAVGEGDEHLVAAIRAADAAEAEVQVAAAEELAGDLADDRPP